ncbi:MAG: hypothetical protein Q9223_005075 [Gallowayella weberi]
MDYLDAAVQVNESMLAKEDKGLPRFRQDIPAFRLDDDETSSHRSGKPVMHQNNRRPEVIHEEVVGDRSPKNERGTQSSSSVRPKSALKAVSQDSTSSDSFYSSKTSSDSGSNRSKQVSWEQGSTRSERESSDTIKDPMVGAEGPPQRRPSSSSQSSKAPSKVSERVLDLLPLSSQTAFQTFRDLCASNGLLDRPIDLGKKDSAEGVCDETILFRFFTARKCDIHEAYNMFQGAHATRAANKSLSFFDCMDVEDFEESRKLYPQWVGRRDKRGNPICVFDFGKMDAKTVNAYRQASASIFGMRTESASEHAVSPDMLRAFVVFDSLTRFVMPLCSGAAGGPDPVHKTLHLVDITGIGIRQFWNLRQYVQDLARLLSGNYPEILDTVFVIGAPSYFSTIWGWIKKWVDAGTVEKLRILPQGEVLPTLKEFIDIENIPTRFGGQFEYETGMSYDLDPVIARRLVWKSGSDNKLPRGPIKWVETGDGNKMAIAVGSQGGKMRKEKLAVLR